ncbi:alpha/beta fold hydrolase [Streptomyces sp. Tu102]|uniref:alpha/beta fold hydrolase n=1 Tax=Streptomyces TaxID=1883 RepID=UPI001BDCB71C|nr:alpha/beta fold hydrolase [Streptomyces sp. Tu102]MBT1098063.1 alpha/beta fold hydrolase [Streptomyces sp. Tu102]
MRPLVLLHPLGSDRKFWDMIPLPAKWETIALDLPGHGEAPLPDVGDGVPGLARHVLDDLAARGVTDFDVAGISLGGLVAQQLAGDHPAAVGRTVLIDTVVRYPEAALPMFHGRAAKVRQQGLEALIDLTLDIWLTKEAIDSNPELADAIRANLRAGHPEGYARTCEILAAADCTEALAAVTSPTLSVCGRDEAAPFVQAAHEIAQVTGADIVWLNGKHGAILESAREFVDHLSRFLAE